MTASAPAFTSDAAAAPSLQPGGPLRRADGTLRRPKADHWLNHYLRGDRGPYERLAAAHGWDSGDSGLRYHGIDSLYAHGYPDEEIAALARAFLPQNQAGRDTARWWARELHSCLYGPKGAATRRPHIERSPSRGFVAPPLMVERDRGGRPQTVTADELLRYYHEESGKRELAGPRARDAEQLGISVPTLDRLDRQLRERGDISIESLPGRSGRRVTLARCYQNLLAEDVAEMLSDAPAPIAAVGVTAPENADLNPQRIGVSQGVAAEAPLTGVAPATTPLCSSPAEEPAGGALSEPGPLDAAGWLGLLGMSAPEPHELADPAAVAAWEVEGSLCPVPADCLPEAPVANGHEGVAGEAGDQHRPATYELPWPVTRKPEAVAFAHGASFDPAVGPLAAQHQASNWALLCEHWQHVAVPTPTGNVAQRVEQSPVSEGAVALPRTLATPAARVRGKGWLRAPPVHHRHALVPRRAGGGREQPVVHLCFDRAVGPDQPDLKRGGPRDERLGPTPGAWCQGAASALEAAGGSPADRFPRQLDGGSR